MSDLTAAERTAIRQRAAALERDCDREAEQVCEDALELLAALDAAEQRAEKAEADLAEGCHLFHVLQAQRDDLQAKLDAAEQERARVIDLIRLHVPRGVLEPLLDEIARGEPTV